MIGIDDVRAIALFDGLSDDQLRRLLAVAREVQFAPGEELFQETRPADYWWVLLDGTIDLVRHVGREEAVLGALSAPGQWAGGFRAWDPTGVYLGTGRAATAGRILQVPAQQLLELANDWFPFGVHFIKGLASTVRRIESVTRQREALVSLGTLAAGLAHEINNPASAATRAVDALAETCQTLLAAPERLAAQSIPAAALRDLDSLRREISAPVSPLTALAMARREEALSDWLLEHDVDRDWLIAPIFAAAGVDINWCDKAAAVVDGPALGAGLEWVASAVSATALLSEVKESTARISNLVAAVKSYAQLDRASLHRMDVNQGLDSTLVMLTHQLEGLTVVRDFAADLPEIEAMAGELNQVWTNLIDNARDAMAGSGTLRVSSRRGSKGVIVEIGDTGAGMPSDVQQHAFEPFYTTKGVGKGVGLGLDISRRIIVERHGGEIDIKSGNEFGTSETVLRVSLPLRPPARN